MTAAIRRYESVVIAQQQLSASLYLLTLGDVADLAIAAQPGQFVQVDCGPSCSVPRPISIFSTDPISGTITLFYRVVGVGTRALSLHPVGSRVTLFGPLGRPFSVGSDGASVVLIAGGIGLAPLHFLAQRLPQKTVLFWGIEEASPWPVVSASAPMVGIPADVHASLSIMAPMGVVSRMSSLTPQPGFFQGYVTQLAAGYLMALSPSERCRTTLAVCGPLPMMRAAADLAHRLGLSGEVSLEERMACGFGGCAGCVAPIAEGSEWYYRRVCLEGPVFSLSQVIWQP
ncbi:MAG: dihydroorotate dehydrogenase electron transfer subunit [Magnetococcales bacterium]|nr:dihydroorotate dehydrogenase electron transfer subunit [Magnetococcales bacterium]